MMNFILPLALLAIWIENSNAFSMHSRLRVLSRNFEQHEKPHTKPDMPTNNIFKAYVQNRMLMQPAEPIESEPMLPMVNKIAQVADMRKATSVVALRVSHLTEITQFMVLVEASNSRQIQAISDTVEEEILSQLGTSPYVKEGTAASGWKVLDYGSVLVHVMSPAMRNFYKLEKRWANAEPVDLSGVLQQPGPSAQSLQDQRSTYSHSSGAQYDSDAGGEGQDKERVWDADIGQSAGFYDVAPGELNAEDAAFWGEDELIRQIQERKKEEYERKQYEQQKQRKEGKGRGAPRTRAAAVAAGLTSDTTVTKRKSKFISMARIGSETSVGVGVGANIGSHVDDLDSSFSSASVARSTSKTTKKVVAKVADDRARLVSGQDSPGDSEAPRVMSGGILDEFYSI